jgi:hypothetical protein
MPRKIWGSITVENMSLHTESWPELIDQREEALDGVQNVNELSWLVASSKSSHCKVGIQFRGVISAL